MTREKTTTWFKHDAGLRNDPRVRAGMAKHGLEFYARFLVVLELLREQRGFRLDSDQPVFWMVLANELHMPDEEQARVFLAELTDKYGLLVTDGRFYWEPNQFADLNNMVEQRKAASQARWSGKPPPPPDATASGPHPAGLRDNPNAMRMSAGVMRSTLSLILRSSSNEDRSKILDQNKVSASERQTLLRLLKQFGLPTVELYGRLVATKFETDPAKYDGRAPLALLERFMIEDHAKGQLKVPPADTSRLPQRQVFTVSGKTPTRNNLGRASENTNETSQTPVRITEMGEARTEDVL